MREYNKYIARLAGMHVLCRHLLEREYYDKLDQIRIRLRDGKITIPDAVQSAIPWNNALFEIVDGMRN